MTSSHKRRPACDLIVIDSDDDPDATTPPAVSKVKPTLPALQEDSLTEQLYQGLNYAYPAPHL